MFNWKLSTALIERLRQSYSWSHASKDLGAGAVVGLVAVPLSMALAIATGVAPQHGLYTAIVAGAIAALLGGSRFQVSGPTAAFVVILAPIVAKFGLGGLLTAGLLAGVILMIMGATGMGRLIQFIPYPVTTGFTAGIGLVIATMQIKDLFGLTIPAEINLHSMHTVQRLTTTVEYFAGLRWQECLIGFSTLFMLWLWPRLNRKIPAPLIVLTVIATLVWLANQLGFSELKVDTIATRFQGIPQSLPTLHLPWSQSGEWNWQMLREILPSALVIAMLAAIESLLSAVIADGMTHTKHDPDTELIALGIANLACPFLGGIPATGAIARTATNIRCGAESPLAAVVHAIVVLLIILILAPLVSHLPMAALAALLMVVAVHMAEIRNFTHIVRVAPKSDILVLLTCFFLTVIFDMVLGVGVGIVLAALLFMRRMAELTSGKAFKVDEISLPGIPTLPHNVIVYEIAGPLFFGATRKAIEALSSIADQVRVVIFDLRKVPAIDVSGLVALESTIEKLAATKRFAILSGVAKPVKRLLNKSKLIHMSNIVAVFDEMEQAIEMARQVQARTQ